jgi:hypothetical protein
MTRSAWDQAIGRLARHRRPHALPMAIETTNGAVVDRCQPLGPSPIPATAGSSPTCCAPTATDYTPTVPGRRHADLQALSRLHDDHPGAKTEVANQFGALLDAPGPTPRPSSTTVATPPQGGHASPPAGRQATRARIRKQLLATTAVLGLRDPPAALELLASHPTCHCVEAASLGFSFGWVMAAC